ncbi:MAG: PKD domain-containing protein [Bacteroidales bacterium]|nr:PKD domain-containing protein [Bacteroidales bacterium]
MKNLVLLFILIISTISFSQKITRGPDIGEIYFIGPTYTDEGLYYSTNFGETAVCVDSTFTSNIMTISADKTSGVIYYVNMQQGLYRSDNYGNQGSWQLINGNIYINIKSGLAEGLIYNAIVSHSEDYGANFIPHSYNGFFGNLCSIEIDNKIGTAYAIVSKSSVTDSIYLLITNDNYENLTIHNVFHRFNNPIGPLSRCVEEGELFTFIYFPNETPATLKHSNDYGYLWTICNEINVTDFYISSFEGGRQPGEVYLLFDFINMMWQNAHIYILHSTDYGITFETFHPFSKGNEPVLANFSTTTPEGNQPLTVDFCNYSIGNILQYEWDFNNDDTIDSYEQSPVYTYHDTGYYSVKLTVIGPDSSNTFIRENYIHVKNVTGLFENKSNHELIFYPNPFSKTINILYYSDKEYNNHELLIYNNTGELIKVIVLIKKLISNRYQFIWDGTDKNGSKCKAGIYIIKLNIKNALPKKILLIY